MTSHELLRGLALAAPGRTRTLVALLLHAASDLLGRVAARLLRGPGGAAGEPVYEFYAQAGAPEGALYVNGELVGTLEGVHRL